MKFNKLMMVIVILMTVILSSSMIYAADDFKSDGDNFSIHDLDFIVPPGYTIDEHTTYEANQTSECFLYNNDTGDAILITVSYDQKYDKLEDIKQKGDEEKTINGKKGYLFDADDARGFSYVEDNKLVIIISDKEADIDKLLK